ncbi:hypothetical protein V1264_006586 [Littorina saxatilis]|uniref:Uncharacterized protein n=2 Tax=Littorina saxatilis TaxID=31220 RepID=A0AAN9AZJ5_9CAEN
MEERQLYPADFKRTQYVRDWKESQYQEEVRRAFTRLQDLSNQKQTKAEALAAWCQEYTESNFPDLGKIAYAVPHFFIGKHSIKWNRNSFCYKHCQESDVRGDNAQSKVGRGLRLLNEEMKQRGETTMFIIGNLMYENVLIWPEEIPEKSRNAFQKQIHKDFPDLLVKEEMRYYTRRDQPDDPRQRGELDITIIHESKGVIFIQVKSFGTHVPPKGSLKGKEKKEQAYDQLNENERVFNNLFKHYTRNPEQKVCKVFALPNLTKEEAVDACKIQEKDGVYLLSKDDLYDDGMETAEREYNMEKLRRWWNNLPDLSTPLSPDFTKDIIARFIGTLSKPRNLDCLTERTHVRTMADGIRLAGRMFKTMGLNHSQDTQKALTATDGAANASGPGAAAAGKADAGADPAADYNRVHVKGPPGSGRTTLLILKAMQFLKATGTPSQSTRSKSCHVIVVNVYRGSKGRPIGFHITNTIQDSYEGTFHDKVHHLPIDILDMQESFVDQVNKLFPAGDKKPDWKDVLFIVDEMLDPVHYWSEIFSALQNDFKDSPVWCADGLMSNNMPGDSGFTALTTECMYACQYPSRRSCIMLTWMKTGYLNTSAKQEKDEFLQRTHSSNHLN